MKLELLTNEQANARNNELLGYQMFRPSHRVVNLYDTKNNALILTEWQDWMSGKKEDFSLQCQKFMAVETEDQLDGIFKLMPDDVKRKDPMLFRFGGKSNGVFFLITDNRYFVIGIRKESNRIIENELDGMEVLAEVGAHGEFRFTYLPRFGFCIRALNRYEFQNLPHFRHDDYFNISSREEKDFTNYVNYSGLYLLVNSRGESIFEDFSEDNDLLRIFLGTPNTLDDAYARRLRYWSYPVSFDPEGCGDRSTPFYRPYGSNRRDNQEATPNIGKGTVTITNHKGETEEVKCIPWCEFAFAETFYK